MSHLLSPELADHLKIPPIAPAKKTKKQKMKDQAVDIFNAAGPILGALRDVAAITPVPYLRTAAGLSVTLWSTIDAVRDNQAQFERLRNTAVRLVVGLDASFSDSENSNQWMDEQVTKIFKTIISDLQTVTSFCEEVTKRPLLKRAMFSMTDKGKIKEFDDKFRNSVLEFQTLSHVKLHESLAKLSDKSSEIIAEQRKGVASVIENENSNMNAIMMELKITQAMVQSIGGRKNRNTSTASSIISSMTMGSNTLSYVSESVNQHLRPPVVQPNGRINNRIEPTQGPGGRPDRIQPTRTSKSTSKPQSKSKHTGTTSKHRSSRQHESESEEEGSGREESEEAASGSEEEQTDEDERRRRQRKQKERERVRRRSPPRSPSPSPVRCPSPRPSPSPGPRHSPPPTSNHGSSPSPQPQPQPSFHPPPHETPYPPPHGSPYPPPNGSSYPPPNGSPYPPPHGSPYPPPQPSPYSPPQPSPYPPPHGSPYPPQPPYNPYQAYTPAPTIQGPVPPGFNPGYMAPGAVLQIGSGTNIAHAGNMMGNNLVYYDKKDSRPPTPDDSDDDRTTRRRRSRRK